MNDYPNTAYKILSHGDWRLLLAEGRYEGSEVDLADGYIHLSAEAQLAETAAKHYAGQSDLMLIQVDLTRLGDELIWEPSRGGSMFPHIYGPLPLTATTSVRPLSVGADGQMSLGQTLARTR